MRSTKRRAGNSPVRSAHRDSPRKTFLPRSKERYIYMYVCMYVRMYVCMCMYVYMEAYTHIHIHTYICIIYIYMHTYMYIYIYTYSYSWGDGALVGLSAASVGEGADDPHAVGASRTANAVVPSS